MANPRKFSEKIALHNQKQAEETAEFEKIMREVQGVTTKDLIQPTPDIADGGIKKCRSAEIYKRMPNNPTREPKNLAGRQAGGPIRHKRVEYGTSPYQNTNMAYLTPPNDHNWRRSSSDSAIHQSLNQTLAQISSCGSLQDNDLALIQQHSHLSLNPAMHRTVSTVENDQCNPGLQAANSMGMVDVRPRSSSQTSRVAYNSLSIAGDGKHEAPNTKNTGSLPDLSSFHLLLPTNYNNTSTNYNTSGMLSNSWENNSPDDTTAAAYGGGTQQSMENQMLDFQVLQMLNNPDSYQPFTIKAESSDAMNIDTKLYNQTEPTTSTMYLNQSIELGHGSLENKPVQDTMLKGYRTPLMRPSPGSSPNLTIKPVNHLDMNHSAPCSPLGIMQKQTDSPYYEDMDGYYENSIKDFAQFSLDDTSNTFGNNLNTTGVSNDVNHLGHRKHQNDSLGGPGIPEIILTDYSSSSLDFSKDILADTLELGQMDIVGLQMLSDPDMIADSFTEDSLRKDLNIN